MSQVKTVWLWPAPRAPRLADLAVLIAVETENWLVEPIEDLARSASHDDSALVVITDEAIARGHPIQKVLDGIAELADATEIDMVFIVGDGYLGTDGSHFAQAGSGAATVSLARSLAVRRDRRARSNVICVPDSMFGNSGSQRSPLPLEVESRDVAATIAYLLGASGDYVNGQVVYLDGGRHLFSSLTS